LLSWLGDLEHRRCDQAKHPIRHGQHLERIAADRAQVDDVRLDQLCDALGGRHAALSPSQAPADDVRVV
jgi:hypothetical protein